MPSCVLLGPFLYLSWPWFYHLVKTQDDFSKVPFFSKSLSSWHYFFSFWTLCPGNKLSLKKFLHLLFKSRKLQWVCLTISVLNNCNRTMNILVFQSNTAHGKTTTSCGYEFVLRNFCWRSVSNFTYFLSQNLLPFWQLIREKELLI